MFGHFATLCMKGINHCMLLHVHGKKTDQLNMIEITKEFVGDNQARLQDCNQVRHLAGFENIKNSPIITTIYSKRKQKDKYSTFNLIRYKRNMRQYFCQCFGLLLVNDSKLIFLPPLQRKKPSDAPAQFF